MGPRLSNWLRALPATLFGVDLRSLALFRGALGAVLLVDLCRRMGDARSFYSDLGVMPRDWLAVFAEPQRISLYLANGQTWFALALLGIEALAALALMLGWRTRLATVLCFVLQASLMNRNPLVLIGGDLLLICLLFWGMFLPLGARWSVDAALSPPPPDHRHLSWASAGLLLQVMSVYFFSAWLKSGPEWNPDFTAVHYALQLDTYATPLGFWLRPYQGLLTALSMAVYYLEMWGPVLVFFPLFNRPLRFVVMLLLMAMHLGFLLCLMLGHFPFVSLTSLTVLAGGWIWDALDRRRQARERRRGPAPLRVYYDRDCGFCLKMCQLLKTLLVLPRAQIAPAQEQPRARTLLEANYSWVIIDHDDRAYLKWPALVVLLRRSPAFAWLGWLLSGRWLVAPGNAVYDFVGRHRGGFGALTSALLPYREARFEIGPAALGAVGVWMAGALLWFGWSRLSAPLLEPAPAALLFGAAILIALLAAAAIGALRPERRSRLAHAGAAFMLLCLLLWNVCTVPQWHLQGRLYRALTPPFRLLRIDQLWNMFAPFPSKEDGWLVIPGELADGSEVDLLQPQRGGVSFDKPAYVSLTHKNIRWHKYQENLWTQKIDQHLYYYGKYLCRQWNGSHPPQQALKSLKMIYMLELSQPPGVVPSVEQRVIWRYQCLPGFGESPAGKP